jgi:hypothetical protein
MNEKLLLTLMRAFLRRKADLGGQRQLASAFIKISSGMCREKLMPRKG